MSSGKCKLKQHWDTTIHLIERPKSGTLTISHAEKNEEQHKSFIHYWQECKILTAILEDSLVVSYKIKHTLIIQSKTELWYLLKRVKTVWNSLSKKLKWRLRTLIDLVHKKYRELGNIKWSYGDAISKTKNLES